MFSEVDNEVFPDSCEVIQLASQQFVYPIFKCGRSSLHQSMEAKGWQFMPLESIQQIKEPITVFLRDPRERFVSGVNTYIQHLQAEGNDLDTHTVLYFVNRYLFLNRHFAPQFFWLLNLARFVGTDAQVQLLDITDISQLTTRHSHAEVRPITEELRKHIDSFSWKKLELYFYLDNILLGRIGQTVSIGDIIKDVKDNHAELYDLIFEKTKNIINVLP